MPFKVEDRPMGCCGMVMGSGFSEFVALPAPTKSRYPTNDDHVKHLQQLVGFQKDVSRNCSIISLSDDQRPVKELAERAGFKTILEFYNPNSGNQVYLMANVLWDSKADYIQDTGDYLDEEDDD